MASGQSEPSTVRASKKQWPVAVMSLAPVETKTASATLDALEAGEDEVFPGALSRGAAEAFKNDPAALQAQMAEIVHTID